MSKEFAKKTINYSSRFSNTKRKSEVEITRGKSKRTRKDIKEKFPNVCFICDKDEEELHEITTFRTDLRVRRCADILADTDLIGKLSRGDLVAQEAKYHNNCLTKLYKKADQKQLGAKCSVEEKKIHSSAFSAVLSYIDESIDALTTENTNCVFKLSDLRKIYEDRMLELCPDTTSPYVHSTRLKERLLAQLQDMSAYKRGRDVYLAYNHVVGEALSDVCCNYDDDAFILSQAAKIIRRDILKKKNKAFDGSFDKDSQESFVSNPLL